MSEWENKIIDITRDTMTALRVSAMFDFFLILNKMGMYDPTLHHKSQNTYKIGTNTFRFFGTDDDQKVRGPGRDILFINEMNGVKQSVYKQLNQRTKELTIGDYNPSDEYHWIYDTILQDPDTFFFVSTYLDNAEHLPPRIVKEIEKYQETDPNYWRIYGLGQRGVAQATIYRGWIQTDKRFKDFEGQEFYGLDFGFNDPTALVRVKYHKEGIYFEQLLYKRNLTSDDIIKELEKLEEKEVITKDSEIYGDSARPEIIEDIAREGWNIHSVKKGKDSVLRGINFIKKHKVYVSKESVDLLKEGRMYKWKVDKDERVLDVPVDLNDHLMDACRYALSTMSKEVGRAGVLDAGDMFG